MDLALAFEIFNINAYSINSVKEDDLRKKYKELVKLNHPDNHQRDDYLKMNEIQEARDLLIGFIKSPIIRNIKPVKKEILNIDIEDLIKVYKNRKYKDIDLGRIVKSETFISFKYIIDKDGEKIESISKAKFNREDRYSINKESELTFSLGDRLEISLADKVKGVLVNGSCIRVAFELEKNIKVDLSLYVKLVV
mgnify:CR=1 FL=1